MAQEISFMAYKVLYTKSYTLYQISSLTCRICNIAFKISKFQIFDISHQIASLMNKISELFRQIRYQKIY